MILAQRSSTRPVRSVALAVVSCLAAAGCVTSYHSRPLPSGPDTHPNPAALKVDVAAFRLAPLKPVAIDPSDGLDPIEVAVLAVLNSPDLEAKRAALGVNAAEVFAAGLLPDPQLGAGVDQPISGPDHMTAVNLSPSLDLAALMARSNLRRAARFTAQQADLDLLWAEWSAAQQARQLAETALANETRAVRLRLVLAAAADRYERSSRALERHDVTLQTTAADLAVKIDAETQLATVEHDALKARRDLNALLNLDAATVLPLVRGPALGTYDAAAVNQALAALPDRRPDLLALKAGYNAQDANLRKAIVAQFPLTQIAAALAKDTAGVTTIGFSTNLILPLFNGGKGEVRLQDATRERLRAEYQARLDQTRAEVTNASAEHIAALRMAALLSADAPRLETLVQPAQAAYARGDIDSQTYLTLTQNVLSKRGDLDDRELAARITQIQLETALFLPPANARAAP
jgi:outer membrane protein TolC